MQFFKIAFSILRSSWKPVLGSGILSLCASEIFRIMCENPCKLGAVSSGEICKGVMNSFNEFVGNEKIVLTLRLSLEGRRLAHSLLFTGREGVGKKTLALQVAKALNCLEIQPDFCGHCMSCKKIDAGTHPDVFLIELQEGKQFLHINQIRTLRQDVFYRPFEGRFRVFIVDDADRMNEAAANSLLKVLEEPPATTQLILVTANFHALLPTIRSRCQTFSFNPIPLESIRNNLSQRAEISTADRELAVRLSQGSLGKALSLDLETFRALRSDVLEFLAVIAAGSSAEQVIALAEVIGKNKEFFEERLSIFYLLLEDLLYLTHGGAESWIANMDQLSALRSMSKQVTPEWVQSAIARLDAIRTGMRININRPLALEDFAYTLAPQ